MRNNYLRSTFCSLLLSQSVALLTKHLNHKSRRPRGNYHPSVSDIYLTCVHAASSSSTLRVITQYFDISVRKKTYDKTEKNNSQNIDNKLKRFSFSSWMTIAVPFFSNFVAVVVIVNFVVRLSTHNWQHFFLVSRHESLPLSNFLLSLVIFVCKWSLPLPPSSFWFLFVFLKLV